jgi:hypothetical protein
VADPNCTLAALSLELESLIVKDYVKKRAMHFEFTVVADESQLSEPIHKKVDS